MLIPTFDDVRAAHDRIRPFIHRTPVLTCATLDRMSGARLWFKCENLQKVGAFKIRGATNAVFSLSHDALRDFDVRRRECAHVERDHENDRIDREYRREHEFLAEQARDECDQERVEEQQIGTGVALDHVQQMHLAERGEDQAVLEQKRDAGRERVGQEKSEDDEDADVPGDTVDETIL